MLMVLLGTIFEHLADVIGLRQSLELVKLDSGFQPGLGLDSGHVLSSREAFALKLFGICQRSHVLVFVFSS